MTATRAEALRAHLPQIDEEFTEEAAGVQWGALLPVLTLLRTQGVRACLAQKVSLTLVEPPPPRSRRWHAPELSVSGPLGLEATVMVGPRSGCYFVSLRDCPALKTVRQPQQAARLIVKALRGSRCER